MGCELRLGRGLGLGLEEFELEFDLESDNEFELKLDCLETLVRKDWERLSRKTNPGLKPNRRRCASVPGIQLSHSSRGSILPLSGHLFTMFGRPALPPPFGLEVEVMPYIKQNNTPPRSHFQADLSTTRRV